MCLLLSCSNNILNKSNQDNSPKIEGYVPKAGYVPDMETAIRIAEAVWLPIYGEKILKRKPYRAKLNGFTWIVEGSLPKGMKGGVPYIEIDKRTCVILKVMHGK